MRSITEQDAVLVVRRSPGGLAIALFVCLGFLMIGAVSSLVLRDALRVSGGGPWLELGLVLLVVPLVLWWWWRSEEFRFDRRGRFLLVTRKRLLGAEQLESFPWAEVRYVDCSVGHFKEATTVDLHLRDGGIITVYQEGSSRTVSQEARDLAARIAAFLGVPLSRD
jgi:hypothetical protein